MDVDDEEDGDDESSSIAEPSPAEPGDASRDASPSSGASSSPASNPNPFAAWSRRLQRSVVADDRRGVPFRVASAADIASALADARALLGERADIAGEMARAIEEDGPLEAATWDGSRAIPPRRPRSTAPRGSRRYSTT